jgi:hypothetical protein
VEIKSLKENGMQVLQDLPEKESQENSSSGEEEE